MIKPLPEHQVPSKPLDLTALLEGLSERCPTKLKVSDDSTKITYCLANSATELNDLWEYTIKSREHTPLVCAEELVVHGSKISDHEKERQEAARSWEQGITNYTPIKTGFFIPQPGGYCYMVTWKDSVRSIRPIFLNEDAIEAQLSPLENKISYVMDGNIYIRNIDSGDVHQVTVNGNDHIVNGLAEYVAQEEMDRFTGLWWSPNGELIAFTSYDDSQIDVLTRIEIDDDGIKAVDFKYPKAGRPNAFVTLHLYDLVTDKVYQIPTDRYGSDYYLPRVKWMTDDALGFITQSRDQKSILCQEAHLDLKSDTIQLYDLWKETDTDHYVNLPNPSDWGCLGSEIPAGSPLCGLYYTTYETGNQKQMKFFTKNIKFGYDKNMTKKSFCHIFSIPVKGPISVSIDNIVDFRVSEGASGIGLVMVANGRSISKPTETSVYRVTFSSEYAFEAEYGFEVAYQSMSTGHGSEIAVAASQVPQRELLRKLNRVFTVIQRSNIMQPPVFAVYDDSNGHVDIFPNQVKAGHPFSPYVINWRIPQFGRIKATDGKDMHFRMLKPFVEDTAPSNKKYPVLVYVYGGPHAQVVKNSWSTWETLFQYLANRGFIVFSLDNRGAYGYGKDFETVMYRTMSQNEIEDQKAGVDFLRTLSFVDPDKIGVFGHSYGGYMSLMLLFCAGTHFNAAVSGAPVTDWSLYDTHYTERYMGTPEDNEDGYHEGNVLNHVSKYDDSKQSLMVYHGTADNNVIFDHSIKLYKALQNNGKLYESIDYPGIKHSMKGTGVKAHWWRMITDFFNRKLK